MSLPALPELGETPWYDKRRAWDTAVATALTGEELDLSPNFVAGTPAWTPKAVKRNGRIEFEGGWQMAAGTSPVTPAATYNGIVTLFTLPPGWRPAKAAIFSANPFGAVALITATIKVNPGGSVEIYVNNGGGSAATTAVFGFDGVRFRTA